MSYNILIIGGTGSLGSELTRFYHSMGWNVTVFSRDGHKQQALNMELPNVNFVLGDICDKDAMRFALEGQQYVVNAAAQKIVSQGEVFVDEFLRVNVLGTQNVMKLCYEMDIFNVLQISSDKATMPTTLYGATKMICESLARNYGFASLRYGNVITSAGSVLNVWEKQIDEGKKITVRTGKWLGKTSYPTRFVLTMDHAVSLVDEALGLINTLDYDSGGSVFVPRSLKAISIDDMARSLGVSNLDWIEKPLLSAEKTHEKLLADNESGFMISDLLVSVNNNGIGELDHKDFCSETADRMSVDEFKEIIGL